MYKIKKDYYVSKNKLKISVEGGIRDQEIGVMSDLRLLTPNFN